MFLVNFWKMLGDATKSTLWKSSYFYGIFLDGALYDVHGLNTFIDKYFNGMSVRRELNIGLTNFLDGKLTDIINWLLTGSYHLFNETFDFSLLLKVLKATIAYPGVSSP